MTKFAVRNAISASTIIASLVLQSGCASAQLSAQSQDENRSQLDGVWRSDGYGYVLDLRGANAVLYHVAGDVCVPSKTSVENLKHYISKGALKIAANGAEGSFIPTLEDYPMQMNRVESVPARCNAPAPDDAIGNFNAFAAYFAEHYAFFDLYDTDWAARVTSARAKVTADTSDEDLFVIFSNLLKPIKDGHVSLTAQVDGSEQTFAANPSVVSRYLTNEAARTGTARSDLNDKFIEAFWLRSIAGDILKQRGKMAGDNRIQYGMLDKEIAYMNFITVAGFAGKGLGHEADDLAELNSVLDKAFKQFEKHGAKALIIDLSVNMGGYDFISRAIASRFATSKVLGYSKRAADSSITQPFGHIITLFDGARFTGPVYVLTSQATVSGGEVLTLALRTLPNVTHAGQPTRGAFSDVLEKELPNGWEITLSNEVYTDADGRNWEARGIEPELPITVFDTAEPVASHRRSVAELVQTIKARLSGS